MSETLQIWLFGGLAAWLGALSGIVLAMKIDVAQLKTVMILISKRAAEILHSPDDHLGLDQLLDEYKKHEYDLPNEQWEELKKRCEEIIANPQCTKSERLLALMVVEFSVHKMLGVRKSL